MHRLQRPAGSVALAFVVAATLHAAPVDFATDPALGAVAVSFDNEVRVFYDLYGAAPGSAGSEAVATGGTNYGLAFDNGLNLFVGNDTGTSFQILKLGNLAPHTPSTAYSTSSSIRSLAFAGDGTLYAASPGGRITRFPVSGTPVTFTVRSDSTTCIGIDLAADQTTLFIVSGGRNVFMLAGADTASGNKVPSTQVFTQLQGGGTACGIRLLAPERAASVKIHGGMLIADARDIKRINAVGTKLAEYKSGGGNANWVDVAVDPRLVFPGLTAGLEPAEYVFWGIEQNDRLLARFQTNAGSVPLQVETTAAVPRGLAINGELRLAQAARLLTLGAGKKTATFLEGTPYKHSWSAEDAGAGDIAVLAYEVRSNGTAETTPLAGLCAPSLDVDCRFLNYFPYQGGTPMAINYSRNRAVVYRGIPSAGFTPPGPGAKDQRTIVYPSSTPPPSPNPSCAPTAAASLLRDPFEPDGHNQFSVDHTNGFFGSDDAVRDGTDVLGGTDYVAVLRFDTRYASYLMKPDPDSITSVQTGSSLPITFIVTDPFSCAPVPGLENVLVLTATELTGTNTKGQILGDSLTPGSLGSTGLAPWVFTEGQWRTNLYLDPAKFIAGNRYVLCINAKAVNNTRDFGEACATIAAVKGSGKK